MILRVRYGLHVIFVYNSVDVPYCAVLVCVCVVWITVLYAHHLFFPPHLPPFQTLQLQPSIKPARGRTQTKTAEQWISRQEQAQSEEVRLAMEDESSAWLKRSSVVRQSGMWIRDIDPGEEGRAHDTSGQIF